MPFYTDINQLPVGARPLSLSYVPELEPSFPDYPHSLDASPVPSTITHHSLLRRELLDVGIFRDTLLPSASMHLGLSAAAYGAGRYLNAVEAKDVVWSAAPVINAWWSAVGRRVITRGMSLQQALGLLSRPERLLLVGVTLWGGRLTYRVVTRSMERRRRPPQFKGEAAPDGDDPRYFDSKQEPGFWDHAIWTLFLPEAVCQVVLSLPLTAPFRHQGAMLTGYHPAVQACAVGLFSAGFALQVLADMQRDQFKKEGKGKDRMCKEGVWSLIRHPNFLGDALIHCSFPLLLYGSDMLAPVELLGCIMNYVVLRYISGDRMTERHQERRYSESNPDKYQDLRLFRASHNSFWPNWRALGNRWLWIVLGAGVAGAGVEQTIHQLL